MRYVSVSQHRTHNLIENIRSQNELITVRRDKLPFAIVGHKEQEFMSTLLLFLQTELGYVSDPRYHKTLDTTSVVWSAIQYGFFSHEVDIFTVKKYPSTNRSCSQVTGDSVCEYIIINPYLLHSIINIYNFIKALIKYRKSNLKCDFEKAVSKANKIGLFDEQYSLVYIYNSNNIKQYVKQELEDYVIYDTQLLEKVVSLSQQNECYNIGRYYNYSDYERGRKNLIHCKTPRWISDKDIFNTTLCSVKKRGWTYYNITPDVLYLNHRYFMFVQQTLYWVIDADVYENTKHKYIIKPNLSSSTNVTEYKKAMSWCSKYNV